MTKKVRTNSVPSSSSEELAGRVDQEFLIPSSKEIIILDLLSEARTPLYGLELVELSNGRLKRGTIYVTLQRLAAQGLIDSVQERRIQPEIGIPRRRYWLTGLGEHTITAYNAARITFTPVLSPA